MLLLVGHGRVEEGSHQRKGKNNLPPSAPTQKYAVISAYQRHSFTFLYINLISMHQSIWSFNIPVLDNPRAFKLSKIGLFKFPHPSTRENCVQSSTEVPHLTVKFFFVNGTISNCDFLVNLPFKAICLPSTSILKDQISSPPHFHLHCRHGQQSNASGLQVGGERGDVDKLYTNWLVHNTLTICHTIPMIPMMQVWRI